MTRVPRSRRRVLAGVGSLGFLALGGFAARPALGLDPVEMNRTERVDEAGLVLDWRATYNGAVLTETDFDAGGGEQPGPVVRVGELLPGDEGSLTVRAAVSEQRDSPLALFVQLATVTAENGVNESERKAGDTTEARAELGDAIEATVWLDVGAATVDAAGACNGRREPGEPVLAEGTLREVADAFASPVRLGPDPDAERPCLGPGASVCLSFTWSLPQSVGNVVQTDSVAFDVGFSAAPCGEGSK